MGKPQLFINFIIYIINQKNNILIKYYIFIIDLKKKYMIQHYLSEEAPRRVLLRHTNVRWVVLSMCCFIWMSMSMLNDYPAMLKN